MCAFKCASADGKTMAERLRSDDESFAGLAFKIATDLSTFDGQGVAYVVPKGSNRGIEIKKEEKYLV